MVYMDVSSNRAFRETRKASKTVAFESLFENIKITESSKGKNSYTLLFELMYMEKSSVYEKSPYTLFFDFFNLEKSIQKATPGANLQKTRKQRRSKTHRHHF